MFKAIKDHIRHRIRKYPHLRYWIKSCQKRWEKYDQFKKKSLDSIDSIDFNNTLVKTIIPVGSNIEITNACNLDCQMCNTKTQERPYRLMAPEVFERIILQLKVTGITTAGLHTVGETFLYKNIAVLLEIAERHNFRIWISTNAQFPERIEEAYKQFPKVVNDIRISMDGSTPETFEKIRRGGSLDKVFESFEVIHRINEGKRDFRIGVTLDSVLNTDTMWELPVYFQRFGKYVDFKNIGFWTISGLPPHSSYFRKTFPYPNLIRDAAPCNLPFTKQYFTHEGKATMCCSDYREELVVGDIMTSSLQEIWDGEEAEKIRAQHRDTESLAISACQNCYTPYEFVTTVSDSFIHYLYLKRPELSKIEFGNSIHSLLEGMNSNMENLDIVSLKRFVENEFSTADKKNWSDLTNTNSVEKLSEINI